MSKSLAATHGSVNVERYMHLLEMAMTAPQGTHEGKLVSLLREAGAPMADSEAIAAGVSNFRTVTSQTNRAREFIAKARLDNYGGSYQTELLQGRKARRGIRRWALVGFVGLCFAAAAVGVYSVRRHMVASTMNAATSPQQQIVAKPKRTTSDVPARHYRGHPHAAVASSGKAPLETEMKHQEIGRERPSSISTGGDIPLTNSAFPSVSPQPSSHPESCPPGVERLGCRGGTRSQPSPTGTPVPSHAHDETTGLGWECNVGYVQKGDACIALRVPAHAHLDISGHGWFCDDGFVPNGEECAR